MPTNRIPIRHRRPGPRITAEAIRLFDQLRRLPCECPERDWSCENYWKWQPCSYCEEAARLNWEIHRELGLKLWETAVEDPDARNPYPAFSYAARNWPPDVEAQKRWQALAAASRAQRRAAKERRP
jgi:hypothetical protein